MLATLYLRWSAWASALAEGIIHVPSFCNRMPKDVRTDCRRRDWRDPQGPPASFGQSSASARARPCDGLSGGAEAAIIAL